MIQIPVQPVSLPISLFVGIDVAKDKLDLARSDTGECFCFSNDMAGISRIIDSFKTIRPTCIVVESTGGLERPLLEALLDASLPVALVNPARVRHFAIGAGFLAKTDRIDAAVLVQFAQAAKVRLTQKCTENQSELDALITCRRQLVRARAVQENCKSSTRCASAVKALLAVIKTLDKQIELLDEKIRKLIDSDDDFKHMDQILRSAPGVGPVLSSTLLAELSELGKNRPARNQCLGRSGALQRRLGKTSGQANHPRRTIPGTQRLVHEQCLRDPT